MGSISKPLLPGYLACVPLSCFPNGNTESIARVKKKREGSPSNLLHLALASDGNLSILLGSFHRPIPVRCNWSVFAREMRSTSEFAMIVLSKCVIHSWKPPQHFLFPVILERQIPCHACSMRGKAQAMLSRCGHFLLVTLVRFKGACNSRVDDVSCPWG